jgi:hypothetical protein
MLNVYKDTWALDVPVCPCDVHFNEFVADRNLRNAAIFHFGTGAHHVVGMAAAERNNAVFGITASTGEYQSYIDLIVRRPEIGNNYKAYFGDIYQIDRRLLPVFDAVTLFHLCEFRTPANDAYGALTDLDMAKVLIDRIKPGGWLLFYKGSMAFDTALPVIAKLEKQRPLVRQPDFNTLQVYRIGRAKAGPTTVKGKTQAGPKAKTRNNSKSSAKPKVGTKAKLKNKTPKRPAGRKAARKKA